MSDHSQILSDWFYRYSNDVHDYLVYYTGNIDVEDLVQEVFIKVSKGLASYTGKSSPKTWIFSIARHTAIDEIRKRKRSPWNESTSYDDKIGGGDHQTPEKQMLQQEEHQELYEAIQSLKKSYRDVVLLRGIKQLTIRETAAILNWKDAKVRTNYYRALKSLKHKLGEGGILDEI